MVRKLESKKEILLYEKIISKVKFRKFVTLLVCILMFSSTLVAAMTIDENIKTNYKVLAKVAEKKNRTNYATYSISSGPVRGYCTVHMYIFRSTNSAYKTNVITLTAPTVNSSGEVYSANAYYQNPFDYTNYQYFDFKVNATIDPTSYITSTRLVGDFTP